MPELKRRSEDITEPQTTEELVRAIYKSIKNTEKILFGNGQPGLCDRMTTQEATTRTLQWAVVVVIALIGILIKIKHI